MKRTGRLLSESDSDGYVRSIVSHEDPGIANWLANRGATQGYLFLRWQGIQTPLTADDQPVAKVVLLEELAFELPFTTSRVTASERKSALLERRSIPTLKH